MTIGEKRNYEDRLNHYIVVLTIAVFLGGKWGGGNHSLVKSLNRFRNSTKIAALKYYFECKINITSRQYSKAITQDVNTKFGLHSFPYPYLFVNLLVTVFCYIFTVHKQGHILSLISTHYCSRPTASVY